MASYLSEFFTPDRLKRYRCLSKRFRLWCGNWPEDLLWHPLAQEWSLDALARSEFEAEGAEEPIIYFEFHESSTTESVSPPYLILYEPDTIEGPEDDPYSRAYGIDPVVFGALFASINYLSYRWEVDGTAVRLPRTGIGSQREILQTLGRGLRRTNYLRRRRDFLSGKVDKSELQKLWTHIGEEAGLLPDRQGSTSAVLDVPQLRALLGEATDLVVAFREWEPDESEKRLIARLLAGEDFPVLKEALDRPDIPEAIRTVTSQLERHGVELDLDYWVYRLRFPMLRREEVRLLLAEPTKKPKPLARKFLASRIGQDPRTLANKGI